MFFDDLPVGYRFTTAERTLPLAEIVGFARRWDPQPFHTDPEAAKESPYGGIIASGFQTILTAFVLTLEADVWNEASMGSPGLDELRWLKPVYPGDTLHAEAEVVSSVPSASRPDRGRTEIQYRIYNQNGEEVAKYRATHILRRRVG
ncbi:MaoC family dehydratase [Nioella ostreopsis]|jgi:acyl dehydratase|uniref:MaoC family dehydratase n=1 Tax=Nioella ostreopsis TaxID=2448479 RepID=UPI000FDAF264|nr:MaoC family dehydratase [Nioella ostreopsis]